MGFMITAMIQARMSSTRLPGKVLMPILGEPMLLRQIERIKHCKMIDNILVITSRESSDSPIWKLCDQSKIACFRGSLEDVLDRYYQASLIYRPDHIVRLTADCPLSDPVIVDQVITMHLSREYEYTSNTVMRSYPDGLDAEVIYSGLLREAWEKSTNPFDREHVTTYMKSNVSQTRLGSLQHKYDFSSMRWTVDYQEDFSFVMEVYDRLYESNHYFNMNDIVKLLEREPDILKINQHIACI
jgi:spore coat polysaccharide biosynthesis protein SpsF